MTRILCASFAMLLLAGVTDAADKGKGKKAAIKKQDNVLVGELKHAFKVLELSDPIYHGHRAKARHEINHAIGHLEKEMHKHGLKAHHRDDGVKVPKSLSDAIVRETVRELGHIAKHISQLTPTNHRKKAAEHVAKAIAELELGLASAKPK